MATSMLNPIWARPPATMVAETASLVVCGDIVNINDMLRHQFILAITCYIATVMVDEKIDNGKQNTSSVGHFDQHGSAPVQ